MKKVYILTWVRDENYGTSLQSFALFQIINHKYKSIFIDYIPKQKTIIAQIKKNPCRTIRTILSRRIKRLVGSLALPYESQDERHLKFIDFKKQFVFSAEIINEQDLEKLNQNADAFVCGSDQIWNPFLYNSHYFLDFVSDNQKKIAYAPSFGTDNFDNSLQLDKISFHIAKIPYLSCREKSGAEWLSAITKQNVPVVLDPTMLITKEEWCSISNHLYNKPKHYILCYFLGKNEKYWKYINAFAKKEKMKLVILPIFGKDFKRKADVYKDVGPREFISLVDGADYVFTDSFHGCIFSILFEKKFIVFMRFNNKNKKNQNTRIENLLNTFYLTERLFSETNSIDSIISSPINYRIVRNILTSERKMSLNYLFNALAKSTGEIN